MGVTVRRITLEHLLEMRDGLYDPNGFTSGTPEEKRQRLLAYGDWIKLGLAGNLAVYTFRNMNGDLVAGADVDYNGQRAGYALDPQEIINYASAHDNETLFDAVQLKAAPDAPLAKRICMNHMAISLVAFWQGIPFFNAGDEILRSKSLDRNSYTSGDWFNKLDLTYRLEQLRRRAAAGVRQPVQLADHGA